MPSGPIYVERHVLSLELGSGRELHIYPSSDPQGTLPSSPTALALVGLGLWSPPQHLLTRAQQETQVTNPGYLLGMLARVTDPMGSGRGAHPTAGPGRTRGSQGTPEVGLAIRGSRHRQEWSLGGSTGSCRASPRSPGSSSPQEILSLGGAVPKSRGMGTRGTGHPPRHAASGGRHVDGQPLVGSCRTHGESQLPRAAPCNGAPGGVASWPAWPMGVAVRSNSPVLPTGPTVGRAPVPLPMGSPRACLDLRPSHAHPRC